MRVVYDTQRGDEYNKHPAERIHQVIQEVKQAQTCQQPHKLGIKFHPDVLDTEKRC